MPPGVIYVASSLNHTIRRVSPAGVVTTTAGLANSSGRRCHRRRRALRFSGSTSRGFDARFAAPIKLVADDGTVSTFVTMLLPGAWTAQVSGVNNTRGIAVVEVYDLP
jgi:hypothetical protein